MRDWDTGYEDSTSSYLGQCRALAKNIANLYVPHCLYIPDSKPLQDAIDTVTLINQPENVELWLPSTLPSTSHDTQCTSGLPQLEY